MIKLLAALLVGVSLVAGQPLEDKETALLMGHQRLFADFCHEAHQNVVASIKATASSTSSFLFSQFFGSANEIGEEVLNAEKQAVEELAKQIGAPATPVDSAPLPEAKIASLIEEGKREIQEKGGVAGLVPGARAATSALVSAANSALFVRLAKARSYLSASALYAGIQSTCDRIAGHESELEQSLASYKRRLLEQEQAEEVRRFVEATSVPKLQCYTTKFIVRLNAFCQLYKNGRGPFMKMLGLVQSQ